MIDPELLQILVCPEDKKPVAEADALLVEKINAAIAEKRAKNRAGETIETPIEGGLVRADGSYLYPIRDDIPIMLVDEAIPLDQF